MTDAKKPLLSNKKHVDMTDGSIVKHIVLFSLPLLIGNVFQLLYNTVDTWVVGNFVSDEAYSAVGSVGPIINMLIGFFSGLASGAGVVISQCFGAGRYDKVKTATHTSVLLTLVMTVAFTVIGVFGTPLFLRLMDTPDEVFADAKTYLVIYFAGIAGLLFYNMGAGILRAVGDSKRPFYYLVVSALLNTVLDLVFVIKFNMGVAGVAYATIIAQGVSAILTFITLFTTKLPVKLSFAEMKPDFPIFNKIIAVGIPAALQMAITSFSNIFVQGYINYFGKNAMGAWTTFHKLDQFILLPMQTVAIAATTFIGQNLGAGKRDRAKRGLSVSLLLSFVSTLIIMVPLLIFAPYAVAFFNSSPEIVSLGLTIVYWVTPTYVICVYNQVAAAALRGAGNSRAPMIIFIVSFVAIRQLYLYVMANFISNTLVTIIYAMPVGWLAASLGIFFYNLFKKDNSVSIVD